MIKIKTGFNPAIPLSHSRIGHQTFTRTGGSATASTSATGYPASAPLNPLTYEFWRPTAMPATWTFDAGLTVSVNYIGIAAHTFKTNGCTVTIQGSANNSTWVTIDSLTPSDNSPIMFLFPPTSYRYWRLSISGSVCSVGVVYIGTTLDMIRPCYGGLTPISLSRDSVIRPNRSEGGQWLGRTVIRSGSSMKVGYTNLTNSWVRTSFKNFINDAVLYPFFFGWRPDNYRDDVGYVSVNDDIKPSNMGRNSLMQVSFDMTGLSSE